MRMALEPEFRIIPAGETDEVMVLDFNYGFGVRLNESMLPDTVTSAIKTALIDKGLSIKSFQQFVIEQLLDDILRIVRFQ